MIRLDSVTRIYETDRGRTVALDSVSLEIERNEFVVLRGPSGSGKTTLLALIAGLIRPTRGAITVEQQAFSEMGAEGKARFRALHIGFVFQMFHLVPYLNILENLMLAAGGPDRKFRAESLLRSLGLTEKFRCYPAELSAGEQQRAAVARALVNKPGILLADEPTGNLDPKNARAVLTVLSEFRAGGGTVVLASHNDLADEFADRILELRQGRILRLS